MTSAAPELPLLSVLIPVRNEELNLKIMLKLLRAVLEVPHEILVVCDSEDDRSVPIVRDMSPRYPQLRLVINTLGRGAVYALKAGVAQARGDYVLLFAADEAGPVLAIEDMLTLMSKGCDLVSCTRYAHGGRRLGGSFLGSLLSRTANAAFHAVVGSLFSDSTTGIKMFRRSVFERFNIESAPVGWVFAFEMAIKAQLMGMQIGEVPIVSIDRLYGGKSTFRLHKWLPEYLRWFLWGAYRMRSRAGRGRSRILWHSRMSQVLAGSRPPA